MNKILKLFISFCFLQLLIPVVGTNPMLSASEVYDSGCVTYELTADKSEITAGKEIKFTLDYESNTPICDYDMFGNENVYIDFDQLVSSPEQVEVSYDHNLFNLSVSDSGNTNLTINQNEFNEEDIADFSGQVVYTIDIDEDISGEKLVESNVNDITINVLEKKVGEANTNIWSTNSYAKKGDTLKFYIRLNTDENPIEQFSGTLALPAGFEYVEGSFNVQNSHYNNYPGLFNIYNNGDTLAFDSSAPFDEMYLLSFDVNVTENHKEYKTNFEADYYGTDFTVIDNDVYTHSFDRGGYSLIEYFNGLLERFNN